MKKRLYFVAASALAVLLMVSCKSSDDDPFDDISTAKKDRPKVESQKKNSLLEQFDMSLSERAKRKEKLRDVSRPLDDNSNAARVFPWRGAETQRSETLHDGMRSNSSPTYYDW